MCNAFIFIYPPIKSHFCDVSSTNGLTWGQRHLGWKQQSWTETEGDPRLLTPVTVGNVTYENVESYVPLLDAGFWRGKEERVRSFEADGAVEPYMYSCGDLNGVTYKHMVKKLRNP